MWTPWAATWACGGPPRPPPRPPPTPPTCPPSAGAAALVRPRALGRGRGVVVVALLSITWLLTYAHLLILSSAFTIMNLTVSFSYLCSVVLYSILFYFTYLCNFLCLRHDLFFIFSMFLYILSYHFKAQVVWHFQKDSTPSSYYFFFTILITLLWNISCSCVVLQRLLKPREVQSRFVYVSNTLNAHAELSTGHRTKF